jgi:hypothetical protein
MNKTNQMNQINPHPSRPSRPDILRERSAVVSLANPPEFAGSSLRILASIDHNGQRLTVQGFSHPKDLA